MRANQSKLHDNTIRAKKHGPNKREAEIARCTRALAAWLGISPITAWLAVSRTRTKENSMTCMYILTSLQLGDRLLHSHERLQRRRISYRGPLSILQPG